MRTLVTGGAGYIGSHTVVQLVEAGHEVVVLDNLCTSRRAALDRVAGLVGASVPLRQVDVRDEAQVQAVLDDVRPDAVVHFAGLKAVGESVGDPERYYRTNVAGTLNLVRAMQRTGCRVLVFSSSATVYGDPAAVPVREDFPLQPTNPYGRSKLMVEQVLRDVAAADPTWRVALLRYFNPVGAHPSGRIGEDPLGVPSNLLPYVCQVAVGRRDRLHVFGDDYPTPDGTGVRDYIHVVDLAAGHLAALHALGHRTGCHVWNLGTGRGYSVLEVVAAFERAAGRAVPHDVVDRRPGDVAVCYADPAQAEADLGWTAKLGIEEMVQDAWAWQAANPQGYPPD
jgi:UDP-glucose 4-epimerase